MKYFKISEFAVSRSFPKLVEVPEAGTTIYNNIVNLIENLLDPVREKLGKPIIVTSGWRPPKLNSAVGGSPTSNHLYGCAADIYTGNNSTDNVKIAKAVLELQIEFDEVICEGAIFNEYGELVSCKWIHVALRQTNNRKKFIFTSDMKNYYRLKYDNGKIFK